MFIIQDEINETIEWPVIVHVAVTGGKNRKYEFTGIFNRLNDEQKKALKAASIIPEDATDEEKANNYSDEEKTDDYLNRTLQFMPDWKGVCNMQKEPIPCNFDNLKKAIASPDGAAIGAAIYRAVNQIAAGVKAKN
jgi:hypothetical protein